jgi:hypothetical protein
MLKTIWREWRAPKLTPREKRPEKPIAPTSDLQIFRGYEPEDLALFD